MRRVTADQFIEWFVSTTELEPPRPRPLIYAESVSVPVYLDVERLRSEVLWRE